MNAPKVKAGIMTILTALFLGLLVSEVARETPVPGTCRTAPIRENLHRLRAILLTLERPFEAVHEVNEYEQYVLMQSAVGLLNDYLLPHLAAEEAVMFPAARQRSPAASGLLIAALKHEHQVARRWIQEMETVAQAPLTDHNAFARRGERLLGLIEAHFEVEETVLFPLLDQDPPTVAGRRQPE